MMNRNQFKNLLCLFVLIDHAQPK